MVAVLPAMVSVAGRSAPVLTATLNATVPLPVPVAPDVKVTNAALLVAVQVHVVADAVTAAVPVPPSGGNVDKLGAPTVNVQVVLGVVGVVLLQADDSVSTATSHPKMMKCFEPGMVLDTIHRRSA